jgi:hypothetical protein
LVSIVDNVCKANIIGLPNVGEYFICAVLNRHGFHHHLLALQ